MNQEKLNLVMTLTDKIISELNESTQSGDVAQFPNLVSKIIKKLYTTSLVGEISDVQPLTGPVGKVATVISGYGGRHSSGTKLRTSILLKVVDASGFSIDDNIVTATASGKVEYIEDTFILVRDVTGTFKKGDFTLGNITAITATYSNRFYAAQVLKNYTGSFLQTPNAEVLEMNTEVLLSTIEAKTRKLKLFISKEAVQDMISMFGLDISEDFLADEFANEMIQEIDAEIISYLRQIASPEPDNVLTNSLGMQSGLMDLANDIIREVYHCAQKISADTRRRQNFFVIADPKTIGLLMISPLQVQTGESKENSYYKGKIGSLYDLYVDPYANENDNYCLVGYTNGFGGTGDSGLIYAPYINQIIPAYDQDSGKNIFFNVVRYGYVPHPQDTGTGNSDSIFFRTFNIDMSNVKNLTVF